MKVEIKYDVPVSALVDMSTGNVERVYVWRDGIEDERTKPPPSRTRPSSPREPS